MCCSPLGGRPKGKIRSDEGFTRYTTCDASQYRDAGPLAKVCGYSLAAAGLPAALTSTTISAATISTAAVTTTAFAAALASAAIGIAANMVTW